MGLLYLLLQNFDTYHNLHTTRSHFYLLPFNCTPLKVAKPWGNHGYWDKYTSYELLLFMDLDNKYYNGALAHNIIS